MCIKIQGDQEPLKYSNRPVRDQQPCRGQSHWDHTFSSLRRLMWTITGSLDLYLHDRMHCAAATWLADWIPAWHMTDVQVFQLNWPVSVCYLHLNYYHESICIGIEQPYVLSLHSNTTRFRSHRWEERPSSRNTNQTELAALGRRRRPLRMGRARRGRSLTPEKRFSQREDPSAII